MPKRELFDVTVKLIHETEKAFLVDDGKTKAWFPKSLVEMEKNPDGTYTLTAPENFLAEKGFI